MNERCPYQGLDQDALICNEATAGEVPYCICAEATDFPETDCVRVQRTRAEAAEAKAAALEQRLAVERMGLMTTISEREQRLRLAEGLMLRLERLALNGGEESITLLRHDLKAYRAAYPKPAASDCLEAAGDESKPPAIRARIVCRHTNESLEAAVQRDKAAREGAEDVPGEHFL